MNSDIVDINNEGGKWIVFSVVVILLIVFAAVNTIETPAVPTIEATIETTIETPVNEETVPNPPPERDPYRWEEEAFPDLFPYNPE